MIYNTPVFSSSHIRNKETGNDDIFQNPWVMNGFVYSSCVILRSTNLHLKIIFLDGVLHEIKQKQFFSKKMNVFFKVKKSKHKRAINLYNFLYK